MVWRQVNAQVKYTHTGCQKTEPRDKRTVVCRPTHVKDCCAIASVGGFLTVKGPTMWPTARIGGVPGPWKGIGCVAAPMSGEKLA